jgi:TATA-box binding protein (TBP) (component of TFIID and TFIIIB)
MVSLPDAIVIKKEENWEGEEKVATVATLASSIPTAVAARFMPRALRDRNGHAMTYVGPVVHNRVYAGNVFNACLFPLDPDAICDALYAKKNRVEFAAPCTSRMREPKCTMLLFDSGVLIVAGCRTKATALLAVARYLHRLRATLGYDVRVQNITNYNVVCTLYIENSRIDLPSFHAAQDDMPFNVFYKPERFTGANCKINGVTFLVFSSGKLVATGIRETAADQAMLERAVTGFLPWVMKHTTYVPPSTAIPVAIPAATANNKRVTGKHPRDSSSNGGVKKRGSKRVKTEGEEEEDADMKAAMSMIEDDLAALRGLRF